MKKWALPLTAGMLLTANPLLAQDVNVYAPDSAWALDFGDDYCRLMRDFSNGSDTVGLLLERTHPNDTMRVVVVGNSIKLFRGAETVGFRFMPSGAPRMSPRLVVELPDGQQYLNLGPQLVGEFEMPAPGTPPGPPPVYSRETEQRKAETISAISLERGVTKPARIDTGSLARPIEALQSCADDLLAYWDLDLEAHRSLTRTVIPGDGTFLMGDNGFPVNPSAGWISQSTIGFEDFARLNGGNNEIRIMVNAEGEPTDCHVHFPSLSESTNESICAQVMENGEFLPALDANGSAIDSYWMTNVFSLTPPFGG